MELEGIDRLRRLLLRLQVSRQQHQLGRSDGENWQSNCSACFRRSTSAAVWLCRPMPHGTAAGQLSAAWADAAAASLSLSRSLSLALNRTPNDIRREQNNRRWQSRPKPPLLVSFEQFKWFLIKAEKSLFNSLPPKAYLKYRNWTFRSQIWKKFCFKVT